MIIPAQPHIISKEPYRFDCKMNEIWTMQLPKDEDGVIDHSLVHSLIHESNSFPIFVFDCNDGIIIIFYKGNGSELEDNGNENLNNGNGK